MAMNPSGFQGSYLGSQYQFSLLLLCAHRAVESGVKFELLTEQESIKGFDDITLKVVESRKIRYIFGQAKHKINVENLKFKMLMTDKNKNKDFVLSKYLKLWDETVNQKPYNEFDMNIYIITNNRISTQKLWPMDWLKLNLVTSQQLYISPKTPQMILFLKMLANDTNFQTELHFLLSDRLSWRSSKMISLTITKFWT
jgi:hypothetical protein